MYLGETAVKNFYQIWLGLLGFANQKYNIAPELKKMRGAEVLNPQQLLPIKNKLWEDERAVSFTA